MKKLIKRFLKKLKAFRRSEYALVLTILAGVFLFFSVIFIFLAIPEFLPSAVNFQPKISPTPAVNTDPTIERFENTVTELKSIKNTHTYSISYQDFTPGAESNNARTIYVSDNNYIVTGPDYGYNQQTKVNENIETVKSYYLNGHQYFNKDNNYLSEYDKSTDFSFPLLSTLGIKYRYNTLLGAYTDNESDFTFKRKAYSPVEIKFTNQIFNITEEYKYAYVQMEYHDTPCVELRGDSFTEYYLSQILNPNGFCKYKILFFDNNNNLQSMGFISPGNIFYAKYDFGYKKVFSDFRLDLTAQDYCDGVKTDLTSLRLSINCPVKTKYFYTDKNYEGVTFLNLGFDTGNLGLYNIPYHTFSYYNIPQFVFEESKGEGDEMPETKGMVKENSTKKAININGINYQYDVYSVKYHAKNYYSEETSKEIPVPEYVFLTKTFYIIVPNDNSINYNDYVFVIKMEDTQNYINGKLVSKPSNPADFETLENILKSIKPLH
jgi:hypothetical protein